MKITKIILYGLRVPLKCPYILSKEYGVQSDTTPIVAEVHTDEGLTGYGECDPWPLFTGDSQASSMVVLTKHLCPQLLGKDPTNINELHRNMDAVIRGNHLTKSALDMAAYDLLGKASGLPVHQILGGKRRDEIRCFWSVGGATPEETAREALQVKENGYYGCMIKIGTAGWRNDIARTLAAREAVGPDFPLVADANQGWDVETAIAYGRACERAELLYFEQPVQSWDVKGMARIRRAINIPISADEGVATLQDAVNLVAAEAADVFSIKVTKHGHLCRRLRHQAVFQLHDRGGHHPGGQPLRSRHGAEPDDEHRPLLFLAAAPGKRYLRFPYPHRQRRGPHHGHAGTRHPDRQGNAGQICGKYLLCRINGGK